MTKQPAYTREKLIEAAIRTVHEHGVSSLTLEAVAREAAVSKGGLLHHFRSKDALIEAILRQLFTEFASQVQHFYDLEPEGKGRWLKAYIRATYQDNPLPLALLKLLMSAVAENAALLALVQADFALWQTRLANDGVSPARAVIIRQACDAYWSEQLLGATHPISPNALMQELLSLVEGA